MSTWMALDALFSVLMELEEDTRILRLSERTSRFLTDLSAGDRLLSTFDFSRPIVETGLAGVGEGELCLARSKCGKFAIRGQLIRAAQQPRRYYFAGAPWLAALQEAPHATVPQMQHFSAQDTQLDQLFHVATEKQMINDLEELNSQLNRANERESRARQARTAFFNFMSHEMRTPLNGVISGLALMEDTEVSSSQSDLIQMMQNSAKNMVNLINHVLDISKLDAGKMKVEPTSFSLRELLASTVQIQETEARRKNNRIAVRVDTEVPGVIEADDAKIRQVLLNLLSNAVKHTTEGRITIRIRQGSEITDLSGDSIPLRFEVIDTGVGIADEDQAHVFEPFYSSDRFSKSKTASTGLGLVIAKRLTEVMGGKLDFLSTAGLGTQFWFEVPVRRGKIAKASQSVREGGNFSRTFDGRVLIVDDNSTNLVLGRMLLEKFGLRVESANSGAEAIEMSVSIPFDLIFMDIAMPDVDGIEATAGIKAELDQGAPPIVAMTAHSEPESRQRYLEAGMSGYICKPATTQTLEEILTRFLSKEKPQRIHRPTHVPSPLSGEIVDSQRTLTLLSEIGRESFEQVLDMFRAELRQKLKAIKRDMRAGAADDVRRDAHTLRSIAESVGATAVGQRLHRIERAAQINDMTAVQSEFSGLAKLALESSVEISRIANR